MLFVEDQGITDPRLNLALEEFLLRNRAITEDILLFYINEPSIIIGRNQNTLEEINHAYVQAHQIQVVRRLSGGGAVYHDLGNLNFSFINPNARGNFHNYKKFTAPVIAVLQALGVPAELSGRNDILVEGRKISGNAQYLSGGRMVSHGTLLFSSDLERVAAALQVKMTKIESKGIKSVRSRVTNIADHLPAPMTMVEFRERLLAGIFAGVSEIPHYHLSEGDWGAIHELVEARYARWEWNYGRSPQFNVHKNRRLHLGEIEARLQVEAGVIQSIRFYGDFLGEAEIAELEGQMTGVRYDREALSARLASLAVERYFGALSAEELLNFLY